MFAQKNKFSNGCLFFSPRQSFPHPVLQYDRFLEYAIKHCSFVHGCVFSRRGGSEGCGQKLCLVVGELAAEPDDLHEVLEHAQVAEGKAPSLE